MSISYDPTKNQRNLEQRGLSFDRVTDLDWDNAWIFEGKRNEYSEVRYIVYSMLRSEDLIIPESMAQDFGFTGVLGKQAHSRLRNCFSSASVESKNQSDSGNIEFSLLNECLHFVCFTETNDGIRVISFRKANSREVKRYEQKIINR